VRAKLDKDLHEFDFFRNSVREMVGIVKSKADSEGKHTPESEWKAWQGWDFGQKKQPSRWLTFSALRMLERIE